MKKQNQTNQKDTPSGQGGVMGGFEIIQLEGEVQLLKRHWWEIYRKGWYRHSDLWGRKWWIRFRWPIESNLP